MTGADRCENCRFYLGRILEPDASERALRASVLLPEGECRWGPQTFIKRRDEWCGQYQASEAK